MSVKEGGVDDPRNHTKQHEMILVLFRVISWIVILKPEVIGFQRVAAV